MKNEDELMIALDMIKTYSDASKIHREQLNDAIQKIENVRMDLIRASRDQVKEAVKSELEEPLNKLQKSADRYWNETTFLVEELKIQAEKNRWRNSFILGIGTSIVLGCMVLGIFLWLPTLDDIEKRRKTYKEVEAAGLDIGTCDGKTCVKVRKNTCHYGEKGNYCIAILK